MIPTYSFLSRLDGARISKAELQLRESEAGSESDKYRSHGRVALGRLQVQVGLSFPVGGTSHW